MAYVSYIYITSSQSHQFVAKLHHNAPNRVLKSCGLVCQFHVLQNHAHRRRQLCVLGAATNELSLLLPSLPPFPFPPPSPFSPSLSPRVWGQ